MTDESLDLGYYRDRYERYRDVVGLTSAGGVRANYIGEAANDVFTLAAEVERLRALVPSHTDGTAAPAVPEAVRLAAWNAWLAAMQTFDGNERPALTAVIDAVWAAATRSTSTPVVPEAVYLDAARAWHAPTDPAHPGLAELNEQLSRAPEFRRAADAVWAVALSHANVVEIRDGHGHLIGYKLDDTREMELRAAAGECLLCPCCPGCPGGDGHCPCECHFRKSAVTPARFVLGQDP